VKARTNKQHQNARIKMRWRGNTLQSAFALRQDQVRVDYTNQQTFAKEIAQKTTMRY